MSIHQLLDHAQPLCARCPFQVQAVHIARALREGAQTVDGLTGHVDGAIAIEHHIFQLLGHLTLVVGDSGRIDARGTAAHHFHLAPAETGLAVEDGQRCALVLHQGLIGTAFAAAVHGDVNLARVGDLGEVGNQISHAHGRGVGLGQAVEHHQDVALQLDGAAIDTAPCVQGHLGGIAGHRVAKAIGKGRVCGHGRLAHVERRAGAIDGCALFIGQTKHVILPIES